MFLGRVIGTTTLALTVKKLEGVPMLIVQPLDKNSAPEGDPLIMADSTRMAGTGELVYYEGGREAALALKEWFVPVDHTIIGIIDGIVQDKKE